MKKSKKIRILREALEKAAAKIAREHVCDSCCTLAPVGGLPARHAPSAATWSLSRSPRGSDEVSHRPRAGGAARRASRARGAARGATVTRNLDREPGFLLLVVMLLPFIAFGTVAVAFDRWRGAVR